MHRRLGTVGRVAFVLQDLEKVKGGEGMLGESGASWQSRASGVCKIPQARFCNLLESSGNYRLTTPASTCESWEKKKKNARL